MKEISNNKPDEAGVHAQEGGVNRNENIIRRKGENRSTSLIFKGDVEEVGAILGMRYERPGDKYQFKKFQKNLIQYVMKNIYNP